MFGMDFALSSSAGKLRGNEVLFIIATSTTADFLNNLYRQKNAGNSIIILFNEEVNGMEPGQGIKKLEDDGSFRSILEMKEVVCSNCGKSFAGKMGTVVVKKCPFCKTPVANPESK